MGETEKERWWNRPYRRKPIFQPFLGELRQLRTVFIFLGVEKHKIGGFRRFFGAIKVGEEKISSLSIEPNF